jgi:two-component system cell cycle sensor histidine kinase/response regulator CckA
MPPQGPLGDEPSAQELSAARAEIAQLSAALRAAEEQATLVFRAAPSVMVITTFDDFTIVDVNDAFEEASGYTRAAVVGRWTGDFPWWPSAAQRDQLLDSLHAHGRAENVETRFIGQGGREVVTLLNARRITLKGVPCILTHTADITERTRAEEARRALEEAERHTERLESLGLIAGGIAHDFNNLLVGILGNAELLLGLSGHAESWQKPLRAILTSAERAAEHTRELLDYAGPGPSKPLSVNLSEIVAEVQVIGAGLVGPGLSLECHVSAQPVWVQVDRGQLSRMLLNLVKNGLEAMNQGPGTLSITLDTEGDAARLRVTDQGSGMDETTEKRIFDPFFSTKQAGHGLGLASVLSIVQRHRGNIRVETAPGCGSTFSIRLPLAQPPCTPGDLDRSGGHPSPESGSMARVDTPQPPNQGRILVVDDELTVRETARALLTELGFKVDEAVDGASAIATVRDASEPFDAVLLDATMPGLDANATLRGLREQAPHLPVLLCSGYSRNDFARELESDAHLDFLAKPYRVNELLRMLAKLMP